MNHPQRYSRAARVIGGPESNLRAWPGEIVQRRFSSMVSLSPEEGRFLQDSLALGRSHPARTELCTAGQIASRLCFLTSGWACSIRILPDGRRQIFEFLIPGDPLGYSLFPRGPEFLSVIALTRVETVEANGWRDLVGAGNFAFPGLRAAFDALDREREQHLLDQVTRLGRQTAYERLAHLLLELHDRMARVGLASRTSLPLPLKQEILAEALGLSVVHLNRTLQMLRRDRMIELKAGVVTFLAPEQMRTIADFQPNQARTDWG
ncbi:MAG: Crp/Fnr family transcriptional regulator [Acetobacteraceae bacterium]|nr:Crp/Fnr family transcriptional regulator [Acetobacteraceae bacterium]MBV8523912.1 Crp/Fnr family transcriptional regulator [Acetobacteraceae bacterium]